MPDEPAPGEKQRDQPSADQAAGKTATRRARLVALLDRHVSKRWLAVLLGISLLGHGIGFAVYSLRRGRAEPEVPHKEISLGEYQFAPEQREGSPVLGAGFSLHIALLEDFDRLARRLLAQRKYRVQQGIEELLRKAHGGDFRDPGLAQLKQQLQERVNEILGVRAISDVIITDLEIQHAPEATGTAVETAGSAPWADGDEPPG